MSLQLTTTDYFTGPGRVRRDQRYAAELTQEIRDNAVDTVKRANLLLGHLVQDGVQIECNPDTGSPVSSGWRPPEVNAGTPGAALRSKHMTGNAVDLYDPEGALDDWCMEHQQVLADIGLWLEHPSSTKGWCHVQRLPPGSYKRVFYP